MKTTRATPAERRKITEVLARYEPEVGIAIVRGRTGKRLYLREESGPEPRAAFVVYLNPPPGPYQHRYRAT